MNNRRKANTPGHPSRRSTDYARRNDSANFAIGLATGIPMPSAGGIVGATIHNATTYDSSSSYDSGSPCGGSDF